MTFNHPCKTFYEQSQSKTLGGRSTAKSAQHPKADLSTTSQKVSLGHKRQ
jgi:hypothetical protein